MKINWKTLGVSFIMIFIVALIGNLFTGTTTRSQWYESIKPSITPPNYVFPIVWTTLFVLIALSLYFAWTSAKKKQKPNLAVFFAVNFIFNIMWSFLFFTLKQPFWAFIDLTLLWISILVLILRTWKINKTASILLWPYLAWVTFAGILNLLIIL